MSASQFRVLPRQQTKQAAADQRQRGISKALTVAFFLLPGMIVFFVFLLMPISQSVYYSLYDWSGLGPIQDFIGLGNYERLFAHKVFQMSVEHTLVILVLSMAVQLPFSLGLALLVGRGDLPGRRFFRTLLFVPYVFSEVISAIMWLFMFQISNGTLNTLLRQFLPFYENIDWLGDRTIIMVTVFIVLTWKFFGFHMLLYMAGLQAIPKDLEEAARVDGATESQVLRRITLPLLAPTVRLTIYLSVLGSFQQFVIVWTMTEGGPAEASSVLATYLYKFGIQRMDLSYGSAIAVVLFVFTLAFSITYQRLFMRGDTLNR